MKSHKLQNIEAMLSVKSSKSVSFGPVKIFEFDHLHTSIIYHLSEEHSSLLCRDSYIHASTKQTKQCSSSREYKSILKQSQFQSSQHVKHKYRQRLLRRKRSIIQRRHAISSYMD